MAASRPSKNNATLDDKKVRQQRISPLVDYHLTTRVQARWGFAENVRQTETHRNPKDIDKTADPAVAWPAC